MSPRAKGPRVVAELGRPETPEETAARKEQNRRNHRDRQTTRNLLLSLAATVGLVAVIVLLVPRADAPIRPTVDYRAVAADAQAGLGTDPVVPDLPEGWRSNVAELRSGADGITSWFIGFITPAGEFLAVSQGVDANDSWVASELEDSRPTGEESIGGREWDVYDYRDRSGRGNLEYALSTSAGEDYYVIYGTADTAEAAMLASAVAEQIEEPS